MNELLDLLALKSLKIAVKEFHSKASIIEFDVLAKPNSKVSKNFISTEGALVIQTKAKPVDGEANAAIIDEVAGIFGVGRADVEILRGDKSKNKRIKLLMEITAKKTKEYYLEKLTLLS